MFNGKMPANIPFPSHPPRLGSPSTPSPPPPLRPSPSSLYPHSLLISLFRCYAATLNRKSRCNLRHRSPADTAVTAAQQIPQLRRPADPPPPPPLPPRETAQQRPSETAIPTPHPLHISLLLALAAALGARDVTFVSTSDSHYRQVDHPLGNHNHLTRATLEAVNDIQKLAWPASLGGDPIARPRAVLALGDLIDDGDSRRGYRNLTAEQFALYAADYGVTGREGLLRFPVIETWGNHDGPPVGREKHGFSVQGEIIRRNRTRKEAGILAQLSDNGLHASWDWDDVHFVLLGIYPADRQHPAVKYNAQWHDPQGALSFLRQDLALRVGSSRRPVVLLRHCGYDTDWWHKDDWAAVHEACKDHNVILHIYGHTGTGVRAWAPEGSDRRWTCVNDGQASKGFFALHLSDRRLRAAYRMKTGVVTSKDAKGAQTHSWSGGWEWRHLLDKPIDPPQPPAAK